jgi:phage terminase small subunit
MAKRGPKGTSPDVKKRRGTDQPCRKVETLFKNHAERPDPEDIPPPAWLSPEAKKIWKRKVDLYRKRNQKVDGFQDALAQYVQLEAQLIKEWGAGITPTASCITQYRTFASEFYDTPASQKVPAAGGGNAANRFGNNGKRKES